MTASTTDDLLTQFRGEVDDLAAQPYLWSDAEIYGYMTEALDAWSKRVEGSYRTLLFPVVAATPVVPPAPVFIRLPHGLLHIREAKLVTAQRYIEPSQSDMHTGPIGHDYGNLFSSAVTYNYGSPYMYIRDYAQSALFLLPIPTQADTLELQCTMTIAVPYAAGMMLPCRDFEDQRLVLHYMKKLAYQKQDADTMDMQRSATFGAMFENDALLRSVRLRSYRRRPRPMTMDGWEA